MSNCFTDVYDGEEYGQICAVPIPADENQISKKDLVVLCGRMKCLLVPILMLLVITQSFHQLIIIVEYHLNQNYISQKLCINKARPQSNCKGKCQMKKNLTEVSNEQAPVDAPLKIKIKAQWFTDQISQWAIHQHAVSKSEWNGEPSPLKYPSPVFTFFHPPA